MPPKRPQTFDDLLRRWGSDESPALHSINALVARNLTFARALRGLSQESLGRRLEQITGRPWSKATVSALERSADGVRPRQFDADDLVALASALDVPLVFFFLPSPAEYHPNMRWVPRPVDEGETAADDAMDEHDLLGVLIGSGDSASAVGAGEASTHVRQTFGELPDVDTDAVPMLVDLSAERLADWRTTLREMLDAVEDTIASRSRGKP